MSAADLQSYRRAVAHFLRDADYDLGRAVRCVNRLGDAAVLADLVDARKSVAAARDRLAVLDPTVEPVDA